MFPRMPQRPSYLPVIKTITNEDGTAVEPADELRIMAPLRATYVREGERDVIRLDGGSATTHPRWSSGVLGIPVSYITPDGLYEQIFSNDTTARFTLTRAVVNGGGTGFVVEEIDYTNILVVRRKVDGTGGDATFATFTNSTTEVPPQTNVELTVGDGLDVPPGYGLFVKLTKGGAGTPIPPGVTLYIVL